MDGLRDFLEQVKKNGHVQGNFLGLLHVLIGRRIEKADGGVVCSGLTWRELAALLKRLRWDVELVKELGLDPEKLPQRDRQRFWYLAITHADVSSVKAVEAGDRLARALKGSKFIVGHAPKS